jgi:hypothetical protein
VAKTLTVFLAADVSKLNRGLGDAERGLKGLGGTAKNLLGPALIAAGIAAAGLAVKLGIDGVKAAIADEAAVAKLTTTLENLGLAHNVEPIEAYIKSLERSLGVSDLELRPAYDRLVRSTQDVGEANKALALALDISAGTGKSLQQVTDALGRAYDGNTQGLSRLGAGLNTTILATKDMDLITGELAKTFGGQATRQSQTFEGQLKRLSTAGDNVKEAFGAGLLKALGDTNKVTQDVVDSLEGIEPVVEGLGAALGIFATTALGGLNDALKSTEKSADNAAAAAAGLGKAAEIAGGGVGDLAGSFFGVNSPLGVFLRLLGNVTGATNNAIKAAGIYTSKLQDQAMAARGAAGAQNVLSRAMGAGTVRLDDDAKAAAINAEAARDAARAREYWTSRITYATVETERNTSAGSRSTSQTNEMTEAQKKSVKAYEKQADVVRGSVTALNTQLGVLADARKAFDDYAQSIETSILSNFSFSQALQPAMNEAGDVSGEAFVTALTKQVTGLQNFANVITSLRASGAEQSLVDQIAAMGPDAGYKLGKELIDKGLVPSVQEQVTAVETIAKETGLNMAEQFKGAGVEAAINLVDNAVAQVRKDRKKLTKLGDGIGKLIGSGIKKEIAQAVAEAVRAAEAAKAAARAEAVAAAEARAQIITDQQVGQAFARIIAASNARTGRDTNPLLA